MPITSAASIGLSGMRAAQLRLDTSAHNVANAQTPHFQRQVVHQTALPDSGVQVQIGREAEAAAAQGGDLDHLADDLVAQRMSAAPGRSQASSHRSPQGEGTPVSAAPGRSQASSHRSPQGEGTPVSAHSFAANLRTVQAQDRMLGVLLDTQG